MKVEPLSIPDVKLIEAKVFSDERGSFSESWNSQRFADLGISANFVQDNHVVTKDTGTVRGLHFQAPPHAQGKLVRVCKGSVLDVAVDIRTSSTSYGRHVSVVLSVENQKQIWVPEGFAHGYITLEPDTEVLYKVTNYYAPDADFGVFWNDPALQIDWRYDQSAVSLSQKDRALPMFAEIQSPF